MARPLRIEIAGAAYHITARCDPGADAFVDDADRLTFLSLLAQTQQRFDVQVLAYNLLPDHFHVLLFTRRANLSRLMRHLCGVYTQAYRRRHGGQGALFHGRFKGILVDREAHLLDACRYVELNAYRLGLAKEPGAWPWSSYPAHAGLAPVPAWLEADGLWAYVLDRPLAGAADRRHAAARYARLVASAPDLQLWPGQLRRQIFLGDEAFVQRTLTQLGKVGRASGGRRSVSARLAQPGRAASAVWADCQRRSASREQALYLAHTEGGLSMTCLARMQGVSVSRISRLVSSFEHQWA
ncbi:transposase [Roseateles koreensis]|uniref:Transposase n=1 Tax=Roseateles koreensis TaxID=2987526 RepID=A0ABT5KQX5_9BURK|nr:transposase [Roseateles koreensis]MDC8784778.1 transposase [Roseateles koreensis]